MVIEALTTVPPCDTKLIRADGAPVEWMVSDTPIPYPEALAAMRERAAAVAAGEAGAAPAGAGAADEAPVTEVVIKPERVLDSALALWINELSDGYTHDSRDLPWVMAGSCGGYFRTGEQLRVTAAAELANQLDAPHNKLLAAILNATGVTAAGGGPVTMFGDPAHCESGELDVVKV